MTDPTRPSRPDDQVRRDAEALGVSVEALPQATEEADDVFKVWDINWQPAMLFLSLETQWRAVASMAGLIWLGLDYVAADVVMRSRPREDRRKMPASRLLSHLRIMERAALAVMNEARS